jgi:hypothetical protein
MTTETQEVNNTEQNSEQKEVVALKLATTSALLPGNRPVEPRHLQVVSTYGAAACLRPVMKSGLHIKKSIMISGNRPITATHLVISETIKILGNRPVAPNEIDDPVTLMGYLD